MKILSKKQVYLVLSLAVMYLLVIGASKSIAEKLTHTVKKGDTLWDICELYYGDASLWPKLWQMNPFVTNPHLLTSGDIITLLEGEPFKTRTASDTSGPGAKKESVPVPTGINISHSTDLKKLGFLSRDPNIWGTIFATEKDKLMLSQKGEYAFVHINTTHEVKTGDILSICRTSPMIKHPVNGEKLGNVLSIHGKAVVKERVGLGRKQATLYEKKNIYRIEIIEAYDPIHLNDKVIPYQAISPCILPISPQQEILANIVASQDQHELITKHSIVYIDRGFLQGVQRGNLLEVAKINVRPDPAPEPDDKQSLNDKPILILPDIPVGLVLIVEARHYTSTGLIVEARETIPNGAYVKDLQWADKTEILSSLIDCPLH